MEKVNVDYSNVALNRLSKTLDKILSPLNKNICSKCDKLGKDINSYWKSLNKGKKNKGCCVQCGGNFGYFIKRVNFSAKEKKYGFNKQHGFFCTEKMRCKLPHKEKSYTCLTYMCESIRNKLSELEKKQIYNFTSYICDIRKYR